MKTRFFFFFFHLCDLDALDPRVCSHLRLILTFLISKTVAGTRGMCDHRSRARSTYKATQKHNKCRRTSRRQPGLETTILIVERDKAFRASDQESSSYYTQTTIIKFVTSLYYVRQTVLHMTRLLIQIVTYTPVTRLRFNKHISTLKDVTQSNESNGIFYLVRLNVV
jgi:hypothetical protein